jgi:tRNA-uridine 2-sulfurtransferase
VLGKHEGYPFFTVGQRKGLGIALGEPMFVTEIRPDTNTVVLGREDDLIRNSMMVGKVNLMKYAALSDTGLEAVTKVRYRDGGTFSTLRPVGKDVEVSFHANVKGIAPGQSAVFYEGDDVVGGGIIHGSF